MDNLASQLWDARATGFSVPRDELGEIDDVAKAYAVQARQVAYSGQKIGGWKLGATAEAALNVIGIDAPFVGPIPKGDIHQSGAQIELFDDHLYFAETEITLQLCDRLPPRNDPYSHAELANAVASWHTSIEIVGFRIEGGPKDLGPRIIADGGANRASILGPTIEPGAATGLEVGIQIGDVSAKGGVQNLIWDHVLDGLAFAVNAQDQLARRIHFDDIIMTGTLTGMTPFTPGAEILADFGGIEVSVKTTAC